MPGVRGGLWGSVGRIPRPHNGVPKTRQLCWRRALIMVLFHVVKCGRRLAFTALMANFWRDIQYAARTLLKSPTAACIAVLALALGIGVNVSAFISVNGVLLHPLPYAQLDRIQTVWQSNPKLHLERTPVSSGDFIDLSQQAASFDALAAYRPAASVLNTGSGSEMARTVHVSPAFFRVLSGKPTFGRTFSSENNTAVVSEAFWRTRLAGARDVIGKKLSLSTGTATIVGVMPDEFDYPLGTEVWLPLLLNPADAQQRTTHDLALLGLLKGGVSQQQAAAELSALSARLANSFPATNADEAFTLAPLQDMTEGTTNRFVLVLLGAAGFVLLLACANIGNLQLARATNRLKEIAVRAALGAGRYQIARHLLAESLLLSSAAGFLGVLLADWNNYYMKQNIPGLAFRAVPGLRTMSVTPAVLFFAFFVAMVAGVVCSLPAIVHLTRRSTYDNLEESLRERSAIGAQHSSGVFRGSLIVSELALALVLLSGAGLMAGSFRHFQNLDQGFDPRHVLTASVSLPEAAYGDPGPRLAYFDRALASLRALPAASSVALSADLGESASFAIQGRPERRSGEPLPGVLATSSEYLQSLRIPLLDGREFLSSDGPRAPRVVVLSQVFAHFYWPNSSPVGQRVQLQKGGEWLTVVGVAADVIDDWFSGKPSSVVYVPYSQMVPNDARFLVRANGDAAAMSLPVRAQLHAIDAAVPLLYLSPMVKTLAEERSGVGAAAQAMSTYAVIALLLAITGIYAVVSYLVSMRTRDIGVHMALGATSGDVLRMMTRQTGRLILGGVAGGLLVSVALTRLITHFLFDAVQLENSLWFGLTGVLLLASFVAAYLPALRASRIDPLTALRHE